MVTSQQSDCRWNARLRIWRALVVVIAELVIGLTIGRAAEKTLWQMGKPDHSSLEFNDQWDFSQGHDPDFTIGKSSLGRDWSGYHPGTDDSPSGHRIHPFRIAFQLDNVPRGTFYLTVDAIFKAPLIPSYFVEVNGKKGKFYFHPTLTYDIGDAVPGFDLIYSIQHLRISLPGAYFQKGQNNLVLTCADDLSRVILPQQKLPDGQISGIYYDALELSQDPEARFEKPKLQATARPTIFYRQHPANEMDEVVVVEVAAERGAQHAKATLQLGKASYSCELPTGYDFGESECAVEVPELSGPAPAKLMVNWGGRSSSTELQLVPQKKWKLFLCPHEHMDPGYNDFRDNIAETHNRNIDAIITTMESHPEFKYNIDHAYVMGDYWTHRGEEWHGRCLKFLREGRLTLPAFAFSINTGLASQEELYRAAYFSAAFSRRYDFPLIYTDQTDVPAHSWALPSILHSMGVKYLAIGINSYRGAIVMHGQLNEKSPFWWEGPDGGKVLTWFSRMYDQREFLFASQQFNASPKVPPGVNSVPIFLQAYGSPAYAADAVMVYGSQGDMSPFDAVEEVTFPEQWNKEFAYPKIVVSTMPDFFQYMESNFGGSFLTLRGDGGAWWDEMAAANAAITGIYRKATERALAAEAAVSLGAILNRGFRAPLEQDREIWDALIWYPEHTWGSPRAWFNLETDLFKELHDDKDSFVWRADLETRHMLHRGLSQITDNIYTRADTIVVFNPLSWTRGGLVELDLERGHGLMDLKTHRAVPLELIRRTPDEELSAMPTAEKNGAMDRVRFRVEEVPPLGYHAYEITSSGSAVPPSDLPITNVIENSFYKIIVDPARGGIASIYDKQLGKELVDGRSPYALDQYVYAGYGHETASLIEQRTRFNSSLLMHGKALPLPNLRVSLAEQGKVVAVRKAPWGSILTLRSSAAHTPVIETEIRLYDEEKVIELVNTLQKEVVRAPEGVYFAFPFTKQQPVIRYEIQNGWVDPMQDQLPGANKEWFSGQHWVSVTNPDLSVGLAINEAPLFMIGDIDRGLWPKELDLRQGTVFSYVMDNYDGDDEKPYQGGVFTFHYTICSTPQFEPATLARFGREQTSPLQIDWVDAVDRYGHPPRPLDMPEAGFIEIDSKDIVLSTWKPAEDGKGYVLRFYNTTDKLVVAHVGFPLLEFESVYQINGLESGESPLTARQGQLELALGPHEISSLRVVGLRLATGRSAQ